MRVVVFLLLVSLNLSADFLSQAQIGTTVPYQVEQMTKRGIDFLVSRQRFRGNWSLGSSYDKQNGVVALAILALLSTGEDPNYGPYKENLQKAVKFLLNQQDETGYFPSSMYHHGFATLALAECYGAIKNPRIGVALQKAVDLILRSQQNNPRKAWRYSPSDRSADTTVSGACMVALFAAKNAGIEVPSQAIEQALQYYKSCQHQSGGFGYTSKNSPGVERTVIGNLVSSLARISKDEDLYQKSYQYMLKNADTARDNYYYYYLYYAAQAYFQADVKEWRKWNKDLIIDLQRRQQVSGSWDDKKHGKVFTTASAILAMALNYRFLPIYERE